VIHPHAVFSISVSDCDAKEVLIQWQFNNLENPMGNPQRTVVHKKNKGEYETCIKMGNIFSLCAVVSHLDEVISTVDVLTFKNVQIKITGKSWLLISNHEKTLRSKTTDITAVCGCERAMGYVLDSQGKECVKRCSDGDSEDSNRGDYEIINVDGTKCIDTWQCSALSLFSNYNVDGFYDGIHYSNWAIYNNQFCYWDPSVKSFSDVIENSNGRRLGRQRNNGTQQAQKGAYICHARFYETGKPAPHANPGQCFDCQEGCRICNDHGLEYPNRCSSCALADDAYGGQFWPLDIEGKSCTQTCGPHQEMVLQDPCEPEYVPVPYCYYYGCYWNEDNCCYEGYQYELQLVCPQAVNLSRQFSHSSNGTNGTNSTVTTYRSNIGGAATNQHLLDWQYVQCQCRPNYVWHADVKECLYRPSYYDSFALPATEALQWGREKMYNHFHASMVIATLLFLFSMVAVGIAWKDDLLGRLKLNQ